MFLIGRAMAPLFDPPRSRGHNLVGEAASSQHVHVSRQDFEGTPLTFPIISSSRRRLQFVPARPIVSFPRQSGTTFRK